MGISCSDPKQIRDIHKKFGKIKLEHFPFYDLRQRIYLRLIKNTKIYHPLNLIEYNKDKAMKCSKKKLVGCNMLVNIMNRFTAFFENYWSYRRFGHDRKNYISSLIMSGQMTRKDALNIISKIQSVEMRKN